MKSRSRSTARRSFLAGVLAFISLGVAGVGQATELRGLIESRNPYNGIVYPRQGATVTLLAWNGLQWIPFRQVVTGPDGMYYFTQVGPGPYVLNVNGLGYNLQVMNLVYQDIPPVLAP